MSSIFAKRLKELVNPEYPGDIEEGAALSIWMPGSLIDKLTTLATECSQTRSGMARELLEIAIQQATDDLFGEGAQLDLIAGAASVPVEVKRELKPKRKVAKSVRATLKGRKR